MTEWNIGDAAIRRGPFDNQTGIVVNSCHEHMTTPHWHLSGGGWDTLTPSNNRVTYEAVYRAEQPKMVEPAGIGSVVKDAGGSLYVKTDNVIVDDSIGNWAKVGISQSYLWDEFSGIQEIHQGMRS